MNLFGFNIQISRSIPGDANAIQPRAVSAEAWLRGEDLGQASSLSNAYQQVAWVYRAVNVLAEQVANVPFVFSAGERGRENLITSGPLLDFYSRPHAGLNRFQYWELRVIWLMLRGECMRVPIYEDAPVPGQPPRAAARRRLKSVLLLDPSRFQHIVEDHQLIGWRYTGFGPGTPLASQVFLPEEVWFEKLPNPFDFWRGFPPLSVAATAAQTDFAAGSFMRGIIENNGDTGVIVRTDKWLSDEQRNQIVAALRDRKRRAGVADRPVLLLGSTEVIKPQLSSSDLQFLENRKFSRAEICAAFGVPEEIVTSTEHAKYDVMTGARLNFIENRVAPLCSRLEAEEQPTIHAIDAAASGWFDLDSLPILQDARRSRLAAARTGFEMGVPFNELNRVLDLGFKPLPWGDAGFVAAGLQKLGEGTSGTSSASLPQPAAQSESDCITRADQWLAELRAGGTGPLDARVSSKLRRFLFEQRGRILAKLASFPAEQRLPESEKPGAAAARMLEQLFDLNSEDQELAALLEFRNAQTSSTAEADLASNERASRDGKLELQEQSVGRLNRELRENLLAELTQSFAGQESDLALRIKTFYNRAAHAVLKDHLCS